MSDQGLADAVARLKAAGLDDPHGEARKLYGLAFANRHGDDVGGLDDAARHARFKEFVQRRANREPYAHISGQRYFWKYCFAVGPEVLDPRPDTETLLEVALKHPFERVLDMGTGSGCIIVSLLTDRPEALGVASDISEDALEIARKNAAEIGRIHRQDVTHRLTFLTSDWFKQVEGRFDLIVSNPPYIAASEMADLQPEVRDFEPRMALTDENDGLDAYRAIATGAMDHLLPRGRILVEIGPTQAEAVSALFKAAGLENITVHRDLDGRDRVVAAQKSG